MITQSILATVEKGRLAKAAEGYATGTYTITLASQSETEIRGFMANGDGKEYGVVLSEGHAFCSCPDAMYRGAVCKHAVALALYVIRTPKVRTEAEEENEELKPVNLKLAKTRPGWVASA
jgi:predicted nucleic acid-binding Zn finger protein